MINILPFLKRYMEYLYGVVLALLVYLVIWLGFFLWERNQKTDIWELIPDNTIGVVESHSLSYLYDLKNIFFNAILSSSSDEKKSELPSIGSYIFDALKHTVRKRIQSIKATISLHIISKYDFGVVLYIEKNEANLFTSYLSGLDTVNFIKTEKRSYLGTTITELKTDNTKEVFSYFEYKNQLVMSRKPTLVENVIRTIKKDKKERDFIKLNNKILFNGFSKKKVFLFVKEKGINDLLSLFLTKNSKNNWQYLFENQSNIISNINANSNNFYLKGEQFSINKNLRFIDLFNGKTKDNLSFRNLLPQETAYYIRLKFDKGEILKKKLSEYWKKNELKQYEAQSRLIKSESNINGLYSNIKNELVLVQLANKKERFLYTQIVNKEHLKKIIALILEKNTDNKKLQSRSVETYSSYQIFHLHIQNIPYKLFGGLFEGFSQSYATIIDNYLVIAASKPTLIKVIETANNKNKQYVFSKDSINKKGKEHITFFIDFFNSWRNINNSLNNFYKPTFSQNRKQFLQLAFLEITLSNSKSIIEYHLHKKDHLSFETEKPQVVYKTFLPSNSWSKPFLVKNHNTNRTEVLLQDQHNNICLISENGKLLWKYKINQKITDEVYQIDRYKNGFLQFTFVAENKIYLLDRLGKPVNGYPIELPPYVQAENFAVIDFDNNKNYRFLVTDIKSNIYMSSIYGTILSNWSPRKFQISLTVPPIYIKTANQNGIVLMHTNGMLNVTKPNSNLYDGFPLLFDTEVRSSVFIEKGNAFNDSYMSFITKEGEFIKVTMNGKLISRKKLSSSFNKKNYNLSIDQVHQRNFLITNQASNKIELLSQEGKKIFYKEFLTINIKKIQYFNFSNNIELVVITDKISHKTYLYHLNGDMLTDQPINSSHEVSVKYDIKKRAYSVYINYKNTSYCLQVGER